MPVGTSALRGSAAYYGAAMAPQLRLWLPIAALVIALVAFLVVLASNGRDTGDERALAVVVRPLAAAGEGRLDLAVATRRVVQGRPLVVDYRGISGTPAAAISLNGPGEPVDGEVELKPGSGRLEIETDDLEPGAYELSVRISGHGRLGTLIAIAAPSIET